jgi:ribosomal protein S27AE
MEFEYMTTFKNQNHLCPICGKSFIMEEYQDNSQMVKECTSIMRNDVCDIVHVTPSIYG